MKVSRDNAGKTRVVKGDKSGLGGQYASDPAKIAEAKTQLEDLKETTQPSYMKRYGMPVRKESLKKMGAVQLAEIIAEAEKFNDVETRGRAMSTAEHKGIWEETLGYSISIKKTGDPFKIS